MGLKLEQYQLKLVDHEYGGEIIRQRASDGFINAIAMCRAVKKEWPEYRRLKSTAWLKENFPKAAGNYSTYTHHFMDGRRINGVRAYQNSMLGVFRDYVTNVWMRDHAPKYFSRVDPPAVQYLETVLAALPTPADYPSLSAPE